MVSEDAIYALIPIVLFLSTAAVIALGLYFRTERIKAQHAGGGEYRKLAEEAVRGQNALLVEVERMNATLKEIEQLLRQV